VTALIAMLEENPRLVLQPGNVMLPDRSEAVRTTLLECAILAGDPTLAELILPYFSKVNADKEKEKQLARCRPHRPKKYLWVCTAALQKRHRHPIKVGKENK
jgi:hypothetical protein